MCHVSALSVPTRRTLAPHFAAVDPVMAALIEAAGPYRLRVQPCDSPFRHLAGAIIGQQISGAAARAITARFVALVADPERQDGFPTPGAVLALGDATLRSAGLSAGKVAALRDLAAKTRSGEVPPAKIAMIGVVMIASSRCWRARVPASRRPLAQSRPAGTRALHLEFNTAAAPGSCRARFAARRSRSRSRRHPRPSRSSR